MMDFLAQMAAGAFLTAVFMVFATVVAAIPYVIYRIFKGTL